MADRTEAGPLAPFASRPFAMLRAATVLSQTGTWMNDVGAGWLMTTLAPSPAMVALVQAATTLPVFLLALPAGAMADVVDRRSLLLAVNAAMALTAAALAATTAAGAMTAPLLLLFTFLLGADAVAGALALPRLRARVEINRLVLLGGLGTALAMAAMALAGSAVAAAVAAALAGASWIACLSSFQLAAQVALPIWVRARGLSLFLTAFFRAMTCGALPWGPVAQQAGLPVALLAAAVGLGAGALVSLRVRLVPGGTDLSPSLHWPAPPHVAPEKGDVGPVMVAVDYAAPTASRAAFAPLIAALRESRLRDGGHGWRLTEALERPGVLTESFLVASWLDHLRQHDRVTAGEQAVQTAIVALLGAAPAVQHHLPADLTARQTAP